MRLPHPVRTPAQDRPAGRRDRPVRAALLVALLAPVLGACSAEDQHQISNLAMPDPATADAPAIFELWRWAWLAAMVTGVIVWGLILYAVWRFRRRSDDEIPVQTRYNMPLEVFYTLAPVVMVVVFFYWTVQVQDQQTRLEPDPDVTIDVVGQQWSWTFNYTEQGEGGTTPYSAGTASQIPTLVLPVDQRVQFNLQSPDVIHDFGVPAFLHKMDVIPGRINRFQVTPTVEGEYRGKCYELCGTYHSRMLFNVEVVSQEKYQAYLDDLADQGFEADEPLLGGSDVRTQAGLEQEGESE